MLNIRRLGERMRAMTTHIELFHLLDIFNVEGMLLEHSDGHCIGIVGRLSCQVPCVLSRLVHADTQLVIFFDFIKVACLDWSCVHRGTAHCRRIWRDLCL